MPFKRTDIMKQALEDPKSIKNIFPKGISVIGRDVKIQQFDDEIHQTAVFLHHYQ